MPTDLRSPGSLDRAAQRVGHDLVPVADAVDGHAAVVRRTDQVGFGSHRFGNVRPVHAPLAPEREHQLMAGELRPVAEVLTVAFGERRTRAGGTALRRSRRRHRRHWRSAVRAWALRYALTCLPRRSPPQRSIVPPTPGAASSSTRRRRASAALSERCGGDIVLKAENLQRTGSFKIRGAMSKLAALGAEAANGVTAGSAGNHAQAIAFAARHAGVACEIFVPVGRATVEDRGVPRLRRDADRGRRLARRRSGRGARTCRRRRHGVLPSVRRSRRHCRAGDARPRADRRRARAATGDRATRRRRAGLRHRDRGEGQRSDGRGDRRSGRGVRSVRRPLRHRPAQSSHSPMESPSSGPARSPARSSSSGSTKWSWSRRTRSPTRWCC